MNSTNDTTDPSCPGRQWYLQSGYSLSMFVFYVMAPFTVVFSFFSHLLCLVAFRTQSKKEKAYVYQVLITIVNATKAVTFSLYVVAVEWGASPRSTSLAWPSYLSCYPCMLFSAYVPIGLHNAIASVSQTLSMFMSADRLHALWKPFSYKSINHKMMRNMVVVFSVLLGVVVNLFHCFRFTVQPVKSQGGTVFYQNALDASFASSLLGNVLNQLKNVVELLGLLALYVFNIGLLWIYRTRRKEAEKTLGTSRTNQEKRRQETEKTLTLLAVTQSLCVSVSSTIKTIFYTVIFLRPSFYTCSGRLYSPLVVGWSLVVDLCDVFCVLAVSKHFRRAVVKYTVCCRKTNAIDVTPYPISKTPNSKQ